VNPPALDTIAPDPSAPAVSVVISTFNRAEALPPTLDALAGQTAPAGSYEVIVVDDGSTDDTHGVLEGRAGDPWLRVLRQPANSGVSAGRNLGIRHARGTLLILLSDDLIVPPNFVERHREMSERHPGCWVVGGFRQLPDESPTPFGRYLESREKRFERARRLRQVEPGVWELGGPTARNLSIPRADLERIGLFDERYVTTCEDQDLAQRAVAALGTRFLYDASLECLHNDQAGELDRYCSFIRRGAADTVRLVRQYPQVHGDAPVARTHRAPRPGDPLLESVRRMLKTAADSTAGLRLLRAAVAVLERLRAPDRLLWPLYRTVIGAAYRTGWSEGTAQAGVPADG
jgi:GT2 family glycosyltransferase